MPPQERSGRVACVVVAASCVLAAVTFQIFDTDFWQHLAVGRAIWESRVVPDRQIWCWPTYGEPFVLPSWAFPRVAMEPRVGDQLETELLRLADASPASSLVLNQLGNLMLMERRLPEARAHLERAQAMNPRLPDFHFRRGLIALGQGRPEEALRELLAERRIAETSSLDVRIGSIHRRLGDAEAARHWYRSAIRLDPGNGAAHDSLRALESGPR